MYTEVFLSTGKTKLVKGTFSQVCGKFMTMGATLTEMATGNMMVEMDGQSVGIIRK